MNHQSKSQKLPELSCPSCGRHHIKDRWPYHKEVEKRFVIWCGSCGFGWQKPFPSAQELTQLYSNQPVYGLHHVSESQGGFPIRLKRISDLISKRGRLLDIGSGIGHFLKIARDDGWQVEGIEPRPEAVKYCYETFGIKVHQGFLENFVCQSEFYDVITLWDVLEHVSDHIQFLEKCIQLLAPGGILVIAIPNASGWPARVFKGSWRYVMSTHLNYFTTGYVNRLLSTRNLTIERVDHTVKLHSLVQGLISRLPVKLETQKIFNLGRENKNRGTHQDKNTEQTKALLTEMNPIRTIRKIAFKLNMMRLPWGIGDMVDLYCRKNP